MKVTLIKPNIGRMEHSLYVDEGRMEPLNLGVLGGIVPEKHEVVLYDDRMEEIPYDEETDIVAITVETYTARRSYEISAEFRKRGVKVIMGGMQPTLIPEEVKDHCDSMFLGDAEFGFVKALEDHEQGKLKAVYQAPVGIAQHPHILPRRDLFKGKGYLPITLMQFSRGCRFACTFCAVSSFFDKKHYVREMKEVVREIEAQDRKFIFFVDDNILSNHEAAKIFCREIAPLNIKWVSQASIDMANDLELMELLVKSGCCGNVIGFESLTPTDLKGMKKAPNLIGKNYSYYERELKILREYGLQTWAAFTIGHENDTWDTMERTLEFALKNKFTFAAFNILVAYPGTPLYKKMESEGRLLYDGKWWLHPEYRFNYAVFKPNLMSPEELTRACFHARANFNSPWSIFTRAWDFKTNMRSLYKFGIYAKYNPIFSKEVFKKHGMKFGLFNHKKAKALTY